MEHAEVKGGKIKERGASLAQQCIALLEKDALDITLLYAVEHWEWLDKFRFGRKLKSVIELNTDFKPAFLTSAGFRDAFNNTVRIHFQARAFKGPLSPCRKVEAYYMDEIEELYRAAAWPEPHVPYLLQMRPGPFIMFSNFWDGFLCIRDMAVSKKYTTKSGEIRDVSLLYEKQIPGQPSRIILDCEAYVKQYEGLLTFDDLVQSVLQVPEALVRALVKIKALNATDEVKFVVKDKCRGDGNKVSFHFTTYILVDPAWDMKKALYEAVIAPYVAQRSICKKQKSSVHIADMVRPVDGRCQHPLLHIDEATIKGKHQFSVAFSRKKEEEPCRLARYITVSKGGDYVVSAPHPMEGIPLDPTHPKACWMLYDGGFAHFRKGMTVLNKAFREATPPVVDVVSVRQNLIGFYFPVVRLELTRTPPPMGGDREKKGGAVRVGRPVLVPVAV
jgi:hypothetical protein